MSLCTVSDAISLNIGEVLLSNPSANVFVFWEFKVHHKGWLINFGGTYRPGLLFCQTDSKHDLTQVVNYPTWLPDCNSHSPAFRIYCIFFLTLDGFQWLFLHRKFWSCLSFHWLSVADWDSFCHHWRDVLWEDIFELGASTVGGKFLSEFRLELIFILLIVMVRPTCLHGFQLLVLLS